MAPPPRYLVSLEGLQDAGVDLERLEGRTQPPIERDKVSNQLALSLQHYAASSVDVREWFLQLFGGDRVSFATEHSINISLSRVKEEYVKLNKGKGPAVTQFLAMPYEPPAVRMAFAEVTSIVREQHEAEERVAVAHEQLSRLQNERDSALFEQANLQMLVDNLHVQYNAALSHSSLLHNSIQSLEAQLKEAKNERNYFRLAFVRSNRRLDKKRAKKDHRKKAVKALLAKVARRENFINRQSGNADVVSGQLIQARRHIAQLKGELYQRDQIIDTLAEQCQEHGARLLSAKVGNAYAPEIRLLCIKLIGSKVPLESIPDVISTVLLAAGTQLSDVPNERTVRRIAGAETLSLAQAHLSDKLSKFTGSLTVQTDETTKYGQQYLATAVRTDERETLVLGMNEMSNKSAQSTLDILKEKLADIERAAGKAGVADRILLQIKSAMSDRAETEVRFSKLLKAYKESVCPEVIANWSELNDNERLAWTQVETFFCSLHLLANFAEIMSECLLGNEEGVAVPEKLGSLVDQTGFKTNEPGVFRLIRTAAKCFARRGSEFGLYGQWRLFLEQRGVSLPNFAPFKGNRFNIVFFNAEVTFVSQPLLIEFLAEVAENRLHKAVLADLKEPLFMSELKVLALIGKAITGPLWRLLETEMHVLDMNHYFRTLTDWLDDAAIDPTEFLAGDSLPFTRDLLHDDPVFRLLIEPNVDIDATAVPIASLCLASLSTLLKRMCKDHLPGGKYFEPSDSLRAATVSVPLHNKTPETVFGFLDNLMLRRPNASSLVNEALIMFSKNATRKWLDSKSPEEATSLAKAAMIDAIDLRRIYKDRSAALKFAAMDKLRGKQEKRRNQLARAAHYCEKFTSNIIADGLWQSAGEVDRKLRAFSDEKQRVLALQRQLQFREKVLRQPPPDGETSKFFRFSAKKVAFSEDQLRARLLRLVSEAAASDTISDEMGWVGKHIEHLFVDVATRAEKWHRGTVIATVPGYPEWYNVVYVSDTDVVHTYKLRDDWNSGILRMV